MRLNLRPRFLLLVLALFAISAPLVWLSVQSVAEGIVEQWAVRYAEKQVQYDKARSLEPILHEVALSRELAESPVLLSWAQKPDDTALEQKALAELENYRRFFADHSYFVALLKNRHYYFNNATDEYAGRQFRYVLDPKASKDAWFFDLVHQDKRVVHINVNPDPELGVTKLWIDVLIHQGNKVLGMAGTGLELTPFIERSVQNMTPGISTLFVDYQGAIQLYRDRDLIDYASVTKTKGEHKTLDLLFHSVSDRTAVHEAMKQARQGGANHVATSFVDMEGRRSLVSVAYLPELDWYEINVFDLGVILPYSQFASLGLVFLMILLFALVLFYLTLGRWVIRPVQALERAMATVEDGHEQAVVPGGVGEIGRLVRHFGRMARALLTSNKELEAKVAERTAALDRLSKIDELTELHNRRGMTERIEAELARSRREGSSVAVLWVDVDLFKQINDGYGHVIGDAALRQVAMLIRTILRPYDVAARWGGDEFLIMLDHASEEIMDRIGTRLQSGVLKGALLQTDQGKVIPLTVSVGGYLARPNESVMTILSKADQALYSAKSLGRNRYQSYSVQDVSSDAPPSL